MAKFFEEPSRTFSEYLLIPGYTGPDCTPDKVSLKTPLVKFKKGEEPALSLNIPMVSAVMQAVSGEEMACALAREGGVSFIYGSQTIESQAAMVRKVKSTKAGFVGSDSNISPEATLEDVIALRTKTGHSTMAVTDNGQADGKLVGIVTSRDYRESRMDHSILVKEFMTPFEKLIVGDEDITLSEANDLIWEHKLNQLPIVDKEQHLKAFVFRKDYESHKDNPNELLDDKKRYIVGAGINTRDYATRVPALVEAGVDVIDTAMSPFALGTSQPATEVMVETFKGTPYDTGLDQKLLAEIADYFRPIRDEALESGLLNPKNLGVNIKTLLYQVPGGMLSNLTSQLKEQGAEDKFYDVLEEVPRVRKDLGEPPLVTPSSQIVGTQAVFNVLMGERYKVATKETKDLLSGKYGQTVKPMNPDVIKKVLGDDPEIITCRPADLIPDELDTLRKECEQWIQQDEDVLSYALFPQVAVDFFKYREAQQTKVDATVADTENGSYPV